MHTRSVQTHDGDAMSKKKPKTPPVREETLDFATRTRRAVLAEMKKMTPEELFQLAVRAGIYTPDGKLTPYYRDDGPPSMARPTD